MFSSPLQIDNLTRNTSLVTAGRVADNFWSRFVGLMGAAGLDAGEGLLITRSNSIHTHFMRFPIDVVYVSRDLHVVHVHRVMAPWRFGCIHRGSHLVVELPAGAAEGTEVGNVLAMRGYQWING
jgi:hypothetical protein